VLILALDTTTHGGSAAVVRDASLLSLVRGDASRTHGERLPGEIAQALAQAEVSAADLDLLVVASGPGPFTGLRIGLAAIQGVAMVTGVPVVGVSALDAIAAALWADVERSTQSRRLVIWIDAQRGEIYQGCYAAAADAGPLPWREEQAPIVAAPIAALASLGEVWRHAAFAGDGAVGAQAQIAAWTGAPMDVRPTPDVLAPVLATLGALAAARGEAGHPHALQPLYVRRPDAELERQRRTAP
jgi:tRNA threonylcarbamoyl adenosine modification protein YeaZ